MPMRPHMPKRRFVHTARHIVNCSGRHDRGAACRSDPSLMGRGSSRKNYPVYVDCLGTCFRGSGVAAGFFAMARSDMPLLRGVSTWVHCAWLAAEWPADVAAAEWRHGVPVPAHD